MQILYMYVRVYNRRNHILKEYLKMEGPGQLKRSMTNKKEKIFNVRRLPYKQFDNQKYLKENYSPLHNDHLLKSDSNTMTLKLQKQLSSNDPRLTVANPVNMEYYYQLSLTSAPVYKQLQGKYKTLKQEFKREKQQKLRILREKEKELQKYISERIKIEEQQERLLQRKEELIYYIQKLRERRERLEYYAGGPEQHEMMNIEVMQDMMMGMHYQGGLDINPDNMTYEELLQLEEKIGKVSKGLSEEQYQKIEVFQAVKKDQEELCSICYYNLKEGEKIHKLECKHVFHCECIKEWLVKERSCPLCKQEIGGEKQIQQQGK